MCSIAWFWGKNLRAVASDEVIPLFVLAPFFFAPERARERFLAVVKGHQGRMTP